MYAYSVAAPVTRTMIASTSHALSTSSFQKSLAEKLSSRVRAGTESIPRTGVFIREFPYAFERRSNGMRRLRDRWNRQRTFRIRGSRCKSTYAETISEAEPHRQRLKY